MDVGDVWGHRSGDRQKDQGELILLGHGVREGKRAWEQQHHSVSSRLLCNYYSGKWRGITEN